MLLCYAVIFVEISRFSDSMSDMLHFFAMSKRQMIWSWEIRKKRLLEDKEVPTRNNSITCIIFLLSWRRSDYYVFRF